jgi:hypothetical protein
MRIARDRLEFHNHDIDVCQGCIDCNNTCSRRKGRAGIAVFLRPFAYFLILEYVVRVNILSVNIPVQLLDAL